MVMEDQERASELLWAIEKAVCGLLCFSNLSERTQNLPLPNPWFEDNNIIHAVKHKTSLLKNKTQNPERPLL